MTRSPLSALDIVSSVVIAAALVAVSCALIRAESMDQPRPRNTLAQRVATDAGDVEAQALALKSQVLAGRRP